MSAEFTPMPEAPVEKKSNKKVIIIVVVVLVVLCCCCAIGVGLYQYGDAILQSLNF
jgi:flagellar basal body-associated protein FliL